MAEPMLCAMDGQGLVGKGWIYELKLDGVRIICDKRGAKVDLWYRKGRSATASYPEIARAVAELPVTDAVLDGEILAFDDEGKPSFQKLERRIGLDRSRDVSAAEQTVPVAFVVFDLLALEERDLRELPLVERRRVLAGILPETGVVRALDYLEDDGTPLFDMCRRERYEGVIAKRAASAYRNGQRTGDWVKIKCAQDEDFVVVGFTGGGARGDLGALDIAAYEGDELVLRGKVGSGLDHKTVEALLPRLAALATDAPVARGDFLPAPRGRTHVWPEIVVSVRYASWTDVGRVRHPVFRGVRHDVLPRDCRAGRPGAPAHEELAEYYAAVGATMLRYLAGRSRVADPARLARTSPPIRIATSGWMVIDCDVVGALALRVLLGELGLPAFVKTGDATEYQVIAPIGDANADGARALAEIACRIAGAGLLRVAGHDVLAPYSPVAGAGSRVSTPLAWDEVTPALDPRRLTTRTVPARLARAGDPMSALLDARVDFAAAVGRLEARVGRGS